MANIIAKTSSKKSSVKKKAVTKTAKAPTEKSLARKAQMQKYDELKAEMMEVAKHFYNEASNVIKASNKQSTLDELLARVKNPSSKMAFDGAEPCPTNRDNAGLAVLYKAFATKAGDPSTFGLDKGVVSRLASASFVSTNKSGNLIALTKVGADRARNLLRQKGLL